MNSVPSSAPSPAPSSVPVSTSAEAVTDQPTVAPAAPAEPASVASAIEQIDEALQNPAVVSALAAEGLQIDHSKIEAAMHDAAGSTATRASDTVAQIETAASEPASEPKPLLVSSSAQLASEPLTPMVPYLPHSPAPVADHAFVVKPTLTDPLSQTCGKEGCNLSEIAHPEPVQTPAEIQARALQLFAPSLADRVAALESWRDSVKIILDHHGIRGPQ